MEENNIQAFPPSLLFTDSTESGEVKQKGNLYLP